MVGDARVDALVAPAGHDDLIGVSQILDEALGERGARGSGDREDTTGRGRGFLRGIGAKGGRQDRVEGARPHVGAHHHAGAAAVGRVVDAAVFATRPLA